MVNYETTSTSLWKTNNNHFFELPILGERKVKIQLGDDIELGEEIWNFEATEIGFLYVIILTPIVHEDKNQRKVFFRLKISSKKILLLIFSRKNFRPPHEIKRHWRVIQKNVFGIQTSIHSFYL